MTNIKLIYTTFSRADDSQIIIKQLLEEQLIACANINSNMQSMYQWEGKICCEDEVSVILKTSDSLVNSAMARLKALHPYKTPCILVLPLSSIDEHFAKWINEVLK
jgi:periplasmic divalent cation tolerance protein